jgi:hypothetical protein
MMRLKTMMEIGRMMRLCCVLVPKGINQRKYLLVLLDMVVQLNKANIVHPAVKGPSMLVKEMRETDMIITLT